MAKAQYLLCAESSRSLLVVLQALDASGKDGVVRHVFIAMIPQGTSASSFKQPSELEAATFRRDSSDFLFAADTRGRKWPRPLAG